MNVGTILHATKQSIKVSDDTIINFRVIVCLYVNIQDPPLTQKEQQELQQKKNSNEQPYTEPLSDFDITNFVTKWTWACDSEQAGQENWNLRLFIIP